MTATSVFFSSLLIYTIILALAILQIVGLLFIIKNAQSLL
nr:MAG TPA: hypothetical protein [Caudoviricetes sp.]